MSRPQSHKPSPAPRARPHVGRPRAGKAGNPPLAKSARAAVARAYVAFLRGQAFRENPPAELRDEADRRLYVQLLRGMVRHRRLLEAETERFSGRKAEAQEAPVAALAHLGLFQLHFLERIPAHAAVYETVALAPVLGRAHAKGWLNALLRNAQREAAIGPGGEKLPLAVRTSHPDLLVARWQAAYGHAAVERVCEANNAVGSTTLRVETGRITPEALVQRLADEGVTATPHRLLRGALEVEHTGALLRSRAFADGLCYVQDVSSQTLTAWAAPVFQGRVLETCCAPGGKLTLLAGLRGKRRLVGADAAQGRLALVRENFARLRLPPAPLLCADGARLPFADQVWDGLLLDVPCSATGMIRKYPELKWRWSEAGLPARVATQRALLAEAARVLRPGGHMLYVTCSLEAEENAENVAALLAARPDLRRVPFLDLAPPRGLGEPPRRFVTRDGDFLMLPAPDRMGMYGALLQKPAPALPARRPPGLEKAGGMGA